MIIEGHQSRMNSSFTENDSDLYYMTNHALNYLELPLEKNSLQNSCEHVTQSLVHARLQQLMFEWLLLPQTAVLVNQLKDNSETVLIAEGFNNQIANSALLDASSIIHLHPTEGYRRDTLEGDPIPYSQVNRRCHSSPAATATATSPSQIHTCFEPGFPSLGDASLQEMSPTQNGIVSRTSSSSSTLLPLSLDFNSALCSPIHPPRSPARRGSFQPVGGSHRSLSDPTLPPSENDSTTATSSLSLAQRSDTETLTGVSTALVGALLKTAAVLAESNGNIQVSNISKISPSLPSNSDSTIDLQQFDSEKKNRLEKSDQSTLCSIGSIDVDFRPQKTVIAKIEPSVESEDSSTSLVSEGHLLKGRRSRHDDRSIEVNVKRQKPSPSPTLKELTVQKNDITITEISDEIKYPSLRHSTTTSPMSSDVNATPSIPRIPKLSTFTIPQFFEPKFIVPKSEIDHETKALIDHAFENLPSVLPSGAMDRPTFESRVIVNLLHMSKYLSDLVFMKIDRKCSGYITKEMLIKFWKGRLILGDETNNFFHLIRQDEFDFIWGYDFAPFIQNILDRHPGMEFLKDSVEFQRRYIMTVTARLLHVFDPYNSKKVTFSELRRFDQRQKLRTAPTTSEITEKDETNISQSLSQIWKGLDTSPDLNHERLFFSYEHFYVIYCTFWEIDQNHDFQLDKQDLLKYDNHALSTRTINRIILTLTQSSSDKGVTNNDTPLISYEEFIVLLLNDEDKTTDRSLEFWFNILDLDGDGYIRYYEMQYFYEEQCQRLEALHHEVVPFSDILCQMNDFLKPQIPGVFTLMDFKRNRATSGVFFDILLSLTKFVAYEIRDPFQLKQELNDFPDFSAWDRFCRREYDKLAIEEDEDEDSRDDIAEWGSNSGIHQDGFLLEDDETRLLPSNNEVSMDSLNRKADTSSTIVEGVLSLASNNVCCYQS